MSTEKEESEAVFEYWKELGDSSMPNCFVLAFCNSVFQITTLSTSVTEKSFDSDWAHYRIDYKWLGFEPRLVLKSHFSYSRFPFSEQKCFLFDLQVLG